MTMIVDSGKRFAKVFYLGVGALAGILALVLVRQYTGCALDVCKTAGSLEAFRFWYWLAATPALCIVSAILGYLSPRKAWIWGLVPLGRAMGVGGSGIICWYRQSGTLRPRGRPRNVHAVRHPKRHRR